MVRFVVFIFFILFFFFISNIWITTLYLDVAYKFNKELKKNMVLKKENEKLKTEVKLLSSPENIIKIAKKKLHMKFANNSQVVIFNE